MNNQKTHSWAEVDSSPWLGFDFSIHNPFCGIPIIENMYMCEAEEYQYRFPRSKKARIRKKWARRPQNWKSIARDQVFKVGNKLVCSPSIHAKLKAEAIRLIENGVVQFNRQPNPSHHDGAAPAPSVDGVVGSPDL